MLPFALKLTWMVLSLIGTVLCWVVLSAFARAVGSYWGPMLYCIACTILEGVFCLGMLWRMDPTRMPDAFCKVQTILIGFGTFMLTGVCTSFVIATCTTVSKPKLWGQESKALAWRPVYIFTICVYPIVASAIQIAVVVKLDSAKASDDIGCNATHPEWVRFLGYAGTPLLLAIPCLLLSVNSVIRTIKTNRHIQRSRSDELDVDNKVTHLPRPMRMRRLLNYMTPTRQIQKSHPTLQLEIKRYRNDLDDAETSPTSSSLPNFVNAPPSSTIVTQDRHSHSDFSANIGETYNSQLTPSDDLADDVSSLVWAPPTTSQLDSTRVVAGHDYDIEENEEKDADSLSVISADTVDRIKRTRPPPRHGLPRIRKRPPPAFLPPFIWRIILFQLAFALVLLLAAISPLIDVITRRHEPTPFGTQHVALLLAAWGPVIVFGIYQFHALRSEAGADDGQVIFRQFGEC